MAIGRIPEPGTGIPESIVDAKGDIVTATAADTPARLAVGTNEQRLVADSAAATGLKYVSDTTNYAVAAKGDLLVGTAADTVAVLSVGTNGHTLVADSSVSPQGLKWAVDPVADVITTAGDLIYGTAADTVARLGIGTAGQVLKVNSGATAPEWGAAAGGSTFVGARVFTGVSQNTTNLTFTTMDFPSETFDTDGFHDNSVNNSRLTIPSGKGGKYFVHAQMEFAANGTGIRAMTLLKNTTTMAEFYIPFTSSAGGITIAVTDVMDLVAGDYLTVKLYQNSGGALGLVADSAYTYFECYLIGA